MLFLYVFKLPVKKNIYIYYIYCSIILISRSCSGAVLLLPLLDVHLSQLSQTVDSIRSTSNTGAANLVSADHSVQTDGPGRQEGTGFSMEDIGLASLRLLFLLVAHSDEVMTNQHRQKHPCSARGHVDVDVDADTIKVYMTREYNCFL